MGGVYWGYGDGYVGGGESGRSAVFGVYGVWRGYG